jgi:rod shape-determining protein MreC
VTLRRRILDWALTGVLILIPALVLRASLVRESPSVVDEALLRITAPLQAGTSWLAEGLGGIWSRYIALVDVESENRELRDENEKLRKELGVMTRKAYDVAALEELALVKKRTAADMIGAHVIGAPMSPEFRVLRLSIDRGADKALKEDMPVLAGAGLVGKIDKVFGDYADVMLVSDTRSHIDVIIKRTGRRGFLDGSGRSDSYACTIATLEQSNKPEERAQLDDEIVTSGAGVFPPGLVVGTISKLEGDNGMFQKVEVHPIVDLARVRAVMVLLAQPPPSDPDAKTRRRSDPAFGARAL